MGWETLYVLHLMTDAIYKSHVEFKTEDRLPLLLLAPDILFKQLLDGPLVQLPLHLLPLDDLVIARNKFSLSQPRLLQSGAEG